MTRKLGNGKEKATLLREVTLRADVSSVWRSSVVRDCHLAGWRCDATRNVRPSELATFLCREQILIRKNVLTLRWRRCAVVSQFSSENADPPLAARQTLFVRPLDDVARSINERFHRETPPKGDSSPTNTRLKSAS